MIDKGFRGVWFIMKLNFIFIVLSFAGLIVLGVGPALQVITELFQESKMDYKEVSFKKGWRLWKEEFKRSNILFWLYNGVVLLLFYNLYLSVQIKGLIWLIIDFILITAILLVFSAYQYVLVYEANYDIDYLDLIKLSFISIFLGFGSFLKLLIGYAIILGFSWAMKGLFVFGTFSLLIAWNVISTSRNRIFVDSRLHIDEE